jgi:hypothetical protein
MKSRNNNFSLLLITLSCAALGLLFYGVNQRFAPNRNKLAIGEDSTLKDTLNIELQSPAELDFKSKDEVLALRREAITLYPDLMDGNYKPSTKVFGQIVDGLPWWGILGQFYYGKGEQSIAGASEESRFILNPYLLIAADPWWMWDIDVFSEATILGDDVSLYCAPRELIWHPYETYTEVHYSAK